MHCNTSWVWLLDGFIFLAVAGEFELLLTVRIPGETALGVSTQWNWFCRADALVCSFWVYFFFFFLSLKWTYENGCIVVRRIKVSFLSVQRCFLRWARHQWPDIISPAHSRLNVFSWLANLCCVAWADWSSLPKAAVFASQLPLQLSSGMQTSCSQCIILKVWPLTNWKPL